MKLSFRVLFSKALAYSIPISRRTYDPYTRMREICAQNKKYMHTCPDELAKLYEEKGKPIQSL